MSLTRLSCVGILRDFYAFMDGHDIVSYGVLLTTCSHPTQSRSPVCKKGVVVKRA